MNKIKQDRNKNIKNIYDENNGNDERNLNIDCPASSLGNRDVRNSPQTVVTNQEKFGPHSPQIVASNQTSPMARFLGQQVA